MIFPIPPRNSFGKDTHAYADGFLTDNEIDKILFFKEWMNPQEATLGSSIENAYTDPKLRVTDVAWLGVTQENTWLWNKITNVIATINSQFFKFDLTGCYENMQLGTYKANNNGHYGWHIDANPASLMPPRKLSVVISLSDPCDFEGGELQVKTDNDEIKTLELKKGRAWFFPSYTLHRVTPVTKGIRKSIVLWVGGPEFK